MQDIACRYVNVLKSVISHKYLVVTVDEKLNFSMHVRNLIKGLRFKGLLLYEVKDCIPSDSLSRVYIAHVLPVFYQPAYCLTLYCGEQVTERVMHRAQSRMGASIRKNVFPGIH